MNPNYPINPQTYEDMVALLEKLWARANTMPHTPHTPDCPFDYGSNIDCTCGAVSLLIALGQIMNALEIDRAVEPVT